MATNKKIYLFYLIIIGLIFSAITLIFVCFPRSKYSELEKRELKSFPKYNDYKEKISSFPAAIGEWFSDSQPYRDVFMSLSMQIRDVLKLTRKNNEDALTFHAPEPTPEEPTVSSLDNDQEIVNPMAEANAKLANAGILIAGNAPEARAIMIFGGSAKSGGQFIEAVNAYSYAFPQCNVYALVASSAGEFYLPEKAKNISNPEGPTLSHIRDSLSGKVKYVNVHDALKPHINENIYLRTDHHWAPLGAFYAAQEFAKVAGVDFKDLDHYDTHVVHNFVGSMFGYSKDIAVKKSPEDFVYYTPRDVDYKTTFITYFTDSDYSITSESKPFESSFFKTYKDGHGGAYSTFIGGDQNLVHVKTNTEGNRKLLLIKDSFGNAIPGYLFYSFSDIHIVDFRYFNRNMKKFIEENSITDILFTFNIFNACNSTSMKKVKTFLTQGDRVKPVKIEKKTEQTEKNNLEEVNSEKDNDPNISEKENISSPENFEEKETPGESEGNNYSSSQE